jgi:ankyrin repeat protein
LAGLGRALGFTIGFKIGEKYGNGCKELRPTSARRVRSKELPRMISNDIPSRLTATDVLRRYKDEELPAFVEITLEDVNQVGNFGERPLHVASVRGDIEEMTALIDGGADVNAHGELGYTSLHETVGQGHIQAVKLLLRHGASPTATNQFGDTPMDIARLRDRDDIVGLLEEWANDPPNPS